MTKRTRVPVLGVRAFALVGAGCLALAGTASADLVGAKITCLGDVGAGVPSFAVYLIFDDPLDQLLAVNGDAGISPLIFDSTSPLVQNNLFEGIQAFDDVPSVADLGGDSWVTLGSPDTHNTAFSPNFLGGDGMASVIKGTHFEQLDNGGYFDENPGSMELPDEDMQIQIAQFSIEEGSFTYEGTASFNLGGGDLTGRAFHVALPSPGAMALFGVAAVAGRRRWGTRR